MMKLFGEIPSARGERVGRISCFVNLFVGNIPVGVAPQKNVYGIPLIPIPLSRTAAGNLLHPYLLPVTWCCSTTISDSTTAPEERFLVTMSAIPDPTSTQPNILLESTSPSPSNTTISAGTPSTGTQHAPQKKRRRIVNAPATADGGEVGVKDEDSPGAVGGMVSPAALGVMAGSEKSEKAPTTSSSFRNVSACNRCRLRKNRCDQRLPACVSCEKAVCLAQDKVVGLERGKGSTDGV